MFFAFFFYPIIWKKFCLSTVNRSRKILNTFDKETGTKIKLPEKQNKRVHIVHSSTMQTINSLPYPQSAHSDTLGWASENKMQHPHLPAFAPIFLCTEDTPTPATDKYIHRHMIHHISGHSSEPLFSGILPHPWPQRLSGAVCSSHGDAVQLWAEVTNVYAGARAALANFIFGPEGVVFILNWSNIFITWSTIKFQISNFAGEKNDLPHFHTQKYFGSEQLPCNRQDLSGSPPSPSPLGLSAFT